LGSRHVYGEAQRETLEKMRGIKLQIDYKTIAFRDRIIMTFIGLCDKIFMDDKKTN